MVKIPSQVSTIMAIKSFKFYGKDARLKRGGKSIKAPRVFEVVTCESDSSNYRYNVEYTNQVVMKTSGSKSMV